MDFFKDFGDVTYSFGNNELASVTPDISKYVDIVDQIKDDIAFLTYYNIKEGESASEDFGRFGDFVNKFVVKGELDKIYHNGKNHLNVVPFSKG